MTDTSMFVASANAITAIAAGLTAFFAYKGLSTWKHEASGRRRSELAEEVLSAFYQANDAVKAIRSPMSFGSEGASRPGRDEEPERERASGDVFYVPIARIEARSEFFADLHAKRYRMRALFGPRVDPPFDLVRSVIAEIQRAALFRMRRVASEARGREMTEREIERMERWEGVIWTDYADDDPIAARMIGAIETIEGICRPVLDPPPPRMSRIPQEITSWLRARYDRAREAVVGRRGR